MRELCVKSASTLISGYKFWKNPVQDLWNALLTKAFMNLG